MLAIGTWDVSNSAYIHSSPAAVIFLLCNTSNEGKLTFRAAGVLKERHSLLVKKTGANILQFLRDPG